MPPVFRSSRLSCTSGQFRWRSVPKSEAKSIEDVSRSLESRANSSPVQKNWNRPCATGSSHQKPVKKSDCLMVCCCVYIYKCVCAFVCVYIYITIIHNFRGSSHGQVLVMTFRNWITLDPVVGRLKTYRGKIVATWCNKCHCCPGRSL